MPNIAKISVLTYQVYKALKQSSRLRHLQPVYIGRFNPFGKSSYQVAFYPENIDRRFGLLPRFASLSDFVDFVKQNQGEQIATLVEQGAMPVLKALLPTTLAEEVKPSVLPHIEEAQKVAADLGKTLVYLKKEKTYVLIYHVQQKPSRAKILPFLKSNQTWSEIYTYSNAKELLADLAKKPYTPPPTAAAAYLGSLPPLPAATVVGGASTPRDQLIITPRACGLSDEGVVRAANQDGVIIDLENNLYLVADGMGGHQGGEVASEALLCFVYTFIKQQLSTLDQPNAAAIKNILKQAINSASRTIQRLAANEQKLHGMGSTIVAAAIIQDQAIIAHLGDSRAYLYQNQELGLLTLDHSLRADYLRLSNPALSPPLKGAELEGFEQDLAQYLSVQNIITRAAGHSSETETIITPLNPGDRLLLCSDGLLAVKDLVPFLAPRDSLADTAHNLRQAALQNGAKDNFSFILYGHYVKF